MAEEAPSEIRTLFQGGSFSRLNEEQCQDLHAASLEILETIGVRLDHAEAVNLLVKAGATRLDNGNVCISRALIENALASVPKRVVLYDRHGNPVMPLEGDSCFFGPGSDCLNIIDHRNGIRRKPVMQDLIEGVILCDGLKNIDFVMSMVLPADVDQTIADIYQMEAMLANTTKPIFVVSYETKGLMDAVQMAEIVLGGPQALREKPIFNLLH